jgi:cytochrome c-type biogenesis protein CcmH
MLQTKLNQNLCHTIHCALLSAAVFLFSAASDPSPHFHDIGHRLMCICGCGQILLECNHVGCSSSDGMRNELSAALARGDSDSLVQKAFVQKYGPTVLAAPTKTGFDRTVWIMPFVVLVLGLTWVIHLARTWRNHPTPVIADNLRRVQGEVLEQYREKARKESET